jgi:hypothetical protein
MSGYQFGHWDTFSRKGNSRNRTVAQVCAEAERVAGNYPHVPNPAPPNLLLGVMPMEALAAHDAHLAGTGGKKPRGKGKGIRQDTHTLSGIVLSYPVACADLQPDTDQLVDYLLWQVDAVRWLEDECRRNGMRLLSLVEHWDESHPHLHCLAVAENERRDVKRCHPGHAAAMAAAKGEETKAFREAMRHWQDRLHQELCASHGMTRLGPGRRRLSRGQWQAEKAAAAALQAEREAVDQERRKVAEQREKLEAERRELERKEQDLHIATIEVGLIEARAMQSIVLAEEAEAQGRFSEILAAEAQAAAEAAEKPLQAVMAAICGWASDEIVDALSTPQNGDTLVYAEELAEERKNSLIEAIRPGFQAAFKVVSALVEVAKRLPEAALAQLRADVTQTTRRVRLR